MAEHWVLRDDLSLENRLRRSYYEVMRDQVDGYVNRYALLDSFERFKIEKKPYPFVEKRELKPRARIPQLEYANQNTFLILLVEDAVPPIHKKYIRFFDDNKAIKSNLIHAKAIPFSTHLERNTKYLESARFFDFLKELLPVDYALMIQRDAATKARVRYRLTHFHVRVDWPIADAAEDLARHLRYISKDLYEKGEQYAEDLQKKFFEYYNVPYMAGGRRTAAIVAAQFLRRLPCRSTIYVGSAESRAAIRISERGVAKSVLMKLSADEMARIAETNEMKLATFKKNYVMHRQGRWGVAIFRANYTHTSHAVPPEDGKLRDLRPDVNWVSVEAQHLMPRPGVWKFAPLPYSVIYS